MTVWTILDFLEPGGKCPFFEWQSRVPLDAQAQIDARLFQMAGLLRWPEKWISKYKTTERIYELRIPFNKIQYRPLGVYAPSRTFILVEGAIERGGKIPANALARAERRQRLLAKESHHVREHRIY